MTGMGSLVWLASYPKSGNTWMRLFLENYFRNDRQPANINEAWRFCFDESKPNWYEPYAGGRPTPDLSPEEIAGIRPRAQRDIANSVPGTVFVKTHNFMGEFDGQPLHNLQVTAGGIYIIRNPLDVVLSVSDHFGLSVDGAIDFMGTDITASLNSETNVSQVLSSWSVNVASWTGSPHDSLLVLRYEDMLDKPGKAFTRVTGFLSEPRDSERVKRAVRFSSFKELRKQESSAGFIERSPNSERFFRKGRKNQWREGLTRDQVRRIVSEHGEQMERFKYVPPGM